jgi:hypothetical protein
VRIAFWKFRVCQLASEKERFFRDGCRRESRRWSCRGDSRVVEEENWSCRGELRRRREEEDRDSFFAEEIEKAWSR